MYSSQHSALQQVAWRSPSSQHYDLISLCLLEGLCLWPVLLFVLALKDGWITLLIQFFLSLKTETLSSLDWPAEVQTRLLHSRTVTSLQSPLKKSREWRSREQLNGPQAKRSTERAVSCSHAGAAHGGRWFTEVAQRGQADAPRRLRGGHANDACLHCGVLPLLHGDSSGTVLISLHSACLRRALLVVPVHSDRFHLLNRFLGGLLG